MDQQDQGPHLGVDISVHQWPKGVPFIMLPRLARAGVRFVTARASIGLATDPSFQENRHRTTFRGWPPGGYHYLSSEPDAKAQADVFMGELARTGGVEGLRTICDVEADSGGLPSLRAIRLFADRFHDQHPAHMLGLYSRASIWAQYGNPDITDLGYDYVWNASWPGGTHNGQDLPARPPISFGGEGRAPFWQWGTLHIPRPHKDDLRLDGDAWYGTLDELRALGVRVRPPLTERPAYILANNAEVQAILASIASRPVPAGTPAQVAGTMAARDAATQAVSEQRITTGGGK